MFMQFFDFKMNSLICQNIILVYMLQFIKPAFSFSSTNERIITFVRTTDVFKKNTVSTVDAFVSKTTTENDTASTLTPYNIFSRENTTEVATASALTTDNIFSIENTTEGAVASALTPDNIFSIENTTEGAVASALTPDNIFSIENTTEGAVASALTPDNIFSSEDTTEDATASALTTDNIFSSEDTTEYITTTDPDPFPSQCSTTNQRPVKLSVGQKVFLQPPEKSEVDGVCFFGFKVDSKEFTLKLTCDELYIAGPENGKLDDCNPDETLHIVDGYSTTILCGRHVEGIKYCASTQSIYMALFGPAKGTNTLLVTALKNCVVTTTRINDHDPICSYTEKNKYNWDYLN